MYTTRGDAINKIQTSGMNIAIAFSDSTFLDDSTDTIYSRFDTCWIFSCNSRVSTEGARLKITRAPKGAMTQVREVSYEEKE